jgi:hypothetical protein
MISGLIIGAIIGGILIIALGIWYTKTQINEQDILDEQLEEETVLQSLLLDIPVEKKLRNALYEAERGESKCIEEVNKIIEMQIDLLEGIGKPSYVYFKEKETYFIVQHPISEEKRYYYSRDLNTGIEPEILSDTHKVLLMYNGHIELYKAKIELFRRLIESHNENLNRINGIHKQHEQLQKLKLHKGKIAELDERTDIDIDALKNEAILEDIERELDFQNQCLSQFSKLSSELDQPFSSQIKIELKEKIKYLIEKIEDEDSAKK